jgi:hypothetical protein
MYYILESQQHALVGMITYPNPGWGLHFTKGNLLDADFGEGQIFVEFEADHDELPDYFELSATPIVSEKFVQQLKTLPFDNYQLFPVIVKMPGGQSAGHYILNVVGRVACVDVDASDTKKYKTKIMRMNKMVLAEDLDADLNMFRANEYPLAIFISEPVRKGLEAGGLTGLLINPADGWSDSHRF